MSNKTKAALAKAAEALVGLDKHEAWEVLDRLAMILPGRTDFVDKQTKQVVRGETLYLGRTAQGHAAYSLRGGLRPIDTNAFRAVDGMRWIEKPVTKLVP